jgi:hypothetical protein
MHTPLLKIAALVTAASSTLLHAEQIDPNAVMLDRLKKTSAATLPGGLVLKSVKISSDLSTDGIRFQMPSIIPERPLVLGQQNITNCSPSPATGKATIRKETENSESFSKSTTFGSETSVSVSYSSPLGLGVSATQSFNYSKSNGEEKTYNDKVSWEQGIDVQVGPRQSLPVQFVVAQQTLDNIPWSTNVLISGLVELRYEKPITPVKLCVFRDANFNGGRKCWTTDKPLGIPRFSEVTWENLQAVALPFINLNDQVSSFTLEGDADVTFFWDANYGSYPVKYDKTSSWIGNHDNDEFSSVRIEPKALNKVVSAQIEKFLSEDLRRIALRGLYRGVNGAQGDFRIGESVPLTDADCKARSTRPSLNSVASAPGSPMGAVAENIPVTPGTQVLQGKILKGGIRPVTGSGR